MLKSRYSITLERALTALVFMILLLDNFLIWREVFWYREYFLAAFIPLEAFISSVPRYELEPGLAIIDYIQLFFPILVLLRHWLVRALFYGTFLWLNVISPTEYHQLTVFGLPSQIFFTIALVGVSFLFCSDLMRTKRLGNQLAKVHDNLIFKSLLFLLAVSVVLASALGAAEHKVNTLQQFVLLYPEYEGLIQTGVPYMQLAVFLILGSAVFSSNKIKVSLIPLSWLVISVTTVPRIEWTGFFYFLDAYTFLSAILVWSVLSPHEPHAEQCRAVRKEHNSKQSSTLEHTSCL